MSPLNLTPEQTSRINYLTNKLLAQLEHNKKTGYSRENMYNLARDYGCLRAYKASFAPLRELVGTICGIANSPEAHAYYGINTYVNPWQFWRDGNNDRINDIVMEYHMNRDIYKDQARYDSLVQEIETEFKEVILAKQERLAKLQPFDAQLLILKSKADELKARKYDPASSVAHALHTTLSRNKTDYSLGVISYNAFKTKSEHSINAAGSLLNGHRGFKELLANIALCISMLIVGYLAVCLYRNSIFKFNTDTVNKLNVFPEIIDSIAPGV